MRWPSGCLSGWSEDGGGGSGAQCQRGELVEVLLTADVWAGQSAQCGLLDAGGILTGDDERVLDLSGVDHVRSQGHAVDEAQAGVGDVEIHRLRAQTDARVDADGHRGFEVLTRDRGVDHQSDRVGGDPSLGEGLLASGDRTVGELIRLIPVASRVDSRNALQQPGRQVEHGQGIGEAIVEFLRGHFVRGEDLSQAEKRHVRVPECCVAIRQLRFSSLCGSFVVVC